MGSSGFFARLLVRFFSRLSATPTTAAASKAQAAAIDRWPKWRRDEGDDIRSVIFLRK
jgi:hypothetical protein